MFLLSQMFAYFKKKYGKFKLNGNYCLFSFMKKTKTIGKWNNKKKDSNEQLNKKNVKYYIYICNENHKKGNINEQKEVINIFNKCTYNLTCK